MGTPPPPQRLAALANGWRQQQLSTPWLMQAIEASPEAFACRQQGLRLADPLEVVARSLRLLGSRHPDTLAISLRGLSAMGQVPANCRPTSPRFQPWALPYRRRPAAPPSRPCLPTLCGNWHDHQMKRRSLFSLLLAGSAGSALAAGRVNAGGSPFQLPAPLLLPLSQSRRLAMALGVGWPSAPPAARPWRAALPWPCSSPPRS